MRRDTTAWRGGGGGVRALRAHFEGILSESGKHEKWVFGEARSLFVDVHAISLLLLLIVTQHNNEIPVHSNSIPDTNAVLVDKQPTKGM